MKIEIIYIIFFLAPFLWKDCTGGTRYSIRPINMKLTKKEKKDLLHPPPSKYIRYPKEIMKMERHISALQRWLQK